MGGSLAHTTHEAMFYSTSRDRKNVILDFILSHWGSKPKKEKKKEKNTSTSLNELWKRQFFFKFLIDLKEAFQNANNAKSFSWERPRVPHTVENCARCSSGCDGILIFRKKPDLEEGIATFSRSELCTQFPEHCIAMVKSLLSTSSLTSRFSVHLGHNLVLIAATRRHTDTGCSCPTCWQGSPQLLTIIESVEVFSHRYKWIVRNLRRG